MPPRFAITALLVAGTGLPARAESTGRADLRAGVGWQDDAVDLARARDTASGGALSQLAARGAWFASALGIAARFEVSRFALARERGLFSPDRLTMTGLDAGAGLALRARVARPLELEGHLGYGYHRLPVVLIGADAAGDTQLGAGGVRWHGPELGARLHLALGARAGLALEGEGTPWLLGARYAGSDVRPHLLTLGAGIDVALFRAGRTRWSALASYEWARATASGDGVALAQRAHRISGGLRVAWQPAARPIVPVAAPAPPPAPAPAAVAILGGVVRAEGQPVPAHVSLPELGLDVTADARGGFRLEVPPGRYTLVIEAAGLIPQRRPVTAAAGERHIYDVDLQRAP